jgi:PHD/YefM family antitoxin component YafN of YafNO toxin-antitoxin module
MKKDLEEMEKFNVEYFQQNFDEIMERVDNGESFVVQSEHGDAMLVPYKEVVNIFEEVGVSEEEFARIYREHEEAP